MSVNPFNYLRPVESGDRLPGRRRPVRAVRAACRSLKEESPRHLCFVGPARTGKTSLLLVARTVAESYDALPVLVPVTRATMRENDGLAEAILESTRLQLLAGGADVGAESAPSVTSPLIDRCRHLIDAARRHRFKGGVVVLLDQMEMIGEDDAAYHSLAALVDYVPHLLLVAAGQPSWLTAARIAFPPVLRRLDVRELDGFEHPLDVREVLMQGNPTSGLPNYRIRGDDLLTFVLAGGMQPFDTTVLAHFAWQAMRRRQEADPRLHLTTRSLRHALGVLREADGGIHEEAFARIQGQLDALDSLDKDDLARAVFAHQYQEMSTSEAALARACVEEGFHGDAGTEAVAMKARVDDDINRLCELGLASRTEDVFELCLDRLSAAYMRARVEELGDQSPHIGFYRYGTTVALAFASHIATLHSGLVDADPFAMQTEDTRREASPQLPDISAAIHARDVLRIVDDLPPSLDISVVPPGNDPAGMCHVGIKFRVYSTEDLALEMDVVTVQHLFWTRASEVAVEAEFARLIREHADDLAALRIKVDAVRVDYLDEALAEDVATLLAPGAMSNRSHAYFNAGNLAQGRDYLRRAVPLLATSLAERPAWWTQDVLQDARTNLGFFACLAGDPDSADEALRDVKTDGWRSAFLVEYNLAHARALRGHFAAAARMLESIPDKYEVVSGPYVMLLFPPPVGGWSPDLPVWMTCSADSQREIELVMRAQTLVYWSLAGAYSDEELGREIAQVPSMRFGGVSRLLGWLQLWRGQNRAAADYFREALRDERAARHARAELAFAEAAGS
jgi:hypothetical protein